MNPLVSILIPAFNAEAWIADTIESALEQTWPRKEIIVVDDGSTDQTLAIARKFIANGVVITHQANQGSAAARNKALSLSRGDYLQWLDADDLLAPDKIARQMEVLDERQSRRTLLSSAWGYFRYRPHKADFSPSPLWCDLSPIEWLVRKLDRNLHMQPATWLVSRELTEAAGPWDTRLSLDDDGEYFCRVILASDGIRFVPEARTFYRRSGAGSLSNVGRSNKKLESQFLSMQLQVGHIRAVEDSERVRRACLTYLQTWLIYFYPERLDIVRQLEHLAVTLGGQLEVPRLPWKYAWLQKLFGWPLAKQSQVSYNVMRESLLRAWDKVLFHAEVRNHPDT